jgi:hypothetical protein
LYKSLVFTLKIAENLFGPFESAISRVDCICLYQELIGF